MILESRLCRNAEKAAESIKDVRLPDFYLERLDGELEILGRIAASPDVVHDILQISPDFLAKYGIDKNVPRRNARVRQRKPTGSWMPVSSE